MFFLIFTGYELFSTTITKRKNKNTSNNKITSNNKNTSTSSILDADVLDASCFVNIYKEKKVNKEKDKIENNENNENNVRCSILLPICNEISVVEQLIASVCKIESPKNCRVEILLLDDSSEENSKIIKKIYDEFIFTDAKKSIFYYRRPDAERIGFKAGNISYGLKYAKGEFIVIFDADNIPPKDFLIKTMFYFEDKNIVFLQTAIEFRNKKENFITRFLALETSHKDDITSNQCNVNNTNSTNIDTSKDYQDFASLTGSSCIWRRSCLDEIGGFSSATLTEDIDLCYRAQLNGWKYVYAENVVSSEELPDSISGLRVQRHRWAYGLIRNAFIYTAKVLVAKDFSFIKKFKALMLIFQTFLLASFVVLLLLSLPLVLVTNELGYTFNIVCTIFLLTTIVWGYNNLSSGKNRLESCIGNDTNIDKDMNIIFFEYIGYILMYLPLSLYYFIALIENIFGIKVFFIPTEKKGLIEKRLLEQGLSKSLVKNSKINNVLFLLEILCCGYAFSVCVLSIYLNNLWTLLYGTICFLAFGMAIYFSVVEQYKKR
ncbi:MAG: glycosyltransferase family 2 protein [Succinivibrionaceae bacterium]